MSKNRTRFAGLTIVGMLIAWIGGLADLSAAEETSVLVNKPENAATPATSGPTLPPPAKPSEPPTTIAPLPVPPSAPPLANPAVKRPFMRPAEPRGMAEQKLDGAESLPLPQNAGPQNAVPQDGRAGLALPPGVKLMPTPPIEYDTDHDARKLYRRTGTVNIVVLTQNPVDGCFYQIPLSIPGSCVGQPSAAGGRGLVTGRGKVEYRWPCGFRAIVKFRQALGDIEVEYEGD